MGTHISRVKSVDLDAWTDEQLQSVLVWGNARANKYWEAKLAPGHVPSEAKIENFIRTKYESKRWVMDGPIPDPSTLDAEGDDDIPLNLVKEKHNIERSASQKTTSSTTQNAGPSSIRRAQQPDLFSDDSGPAPRASTTTPRAATRPPPKAEAAPPKQTKPADSLLGLDFFGTEAAPPNRPSSAAAVGTTSGQSRPDLKQSILSLYATAPRPPQPQQSQPVSHGSFGGMQPAIPQQQQSSFGGLNDAFGGLSFSSTPTPPAQQPAKPNAFAGLGSIQSHQKSPSITSPTSSGFGGGSFFDAKPVQNTAPPPPPKNTRTFSNSSGFGDFGSAPGISPAVTAPPAASSGLGDLFDFSTPSAAPAPPPKQTVSSPSYQQSVFNLSTPSAPPPQTTTQPQASNMSGWNNSDAWGSNDAWGAPVSAAKATPHVTPAPPLQSSSNDFGWGSSGLANQSIVPGGGGGFSPTSAAPPKVAADEDFGGWSSAAPVTPGAGTASTPAKPAAAGGFNTSEDLFSNVWE